MQGVKGTQLHFDSCAALFLNMVANFDLVRVMFVTAIELTKECDLKFCC